MRALITGVAGQDGSYLAEYLLDLGYEVHGMIRFEKDQAWNLSDVVKERVHFHYGDLRDEMSIQTIIRKVMPDEIYNLAGQVFVPTSWLQPAETFDINVGGLTRILKYVEMVCPRARVYQASSSEMYGNHPDLEAVEILEDGSASVKLNEEHRMYPVSPYGTSKYAAHKLVSVYRQKDLFVVSGILFNHESPRRGPEMVTRKITKHIAQWAVHPQDRTVLELGNIKSRRDWGFAGDYVRAMHKMLQQSSPEDFVVGMGHSHSVEDFLHRALAMAGLNWEEYGPLIQTNAKLFARQNELKTLIADASKAHKKLQWDPWVSFDGLVEQMILRDIEEAKRAVNFVHWKPS